ncbi:MULTISPECIES: HNH endonuclease signature motif containing protein [Streptacidiphilus]|uniref:HNH endonuclease signature motif containing protein n=1 Tax=Streptacidiphilus cavernicola TaxID=3342716 RepID=A0ABV6UE65_9ACTN|nr:HNH endonuclease signature motif containing protein [Streptacidiphilus jeojiense]
MPTLKYTQDLLTEVAAASKSITEMMRRLDVPLAGGTHSYLSRRLRHYGIDTSHFTDLNRPTQARRTYTREALAEAAVHSRSVGDVMRYLGIAPYNSAYSYLTSRLTHFGIDTSHFAAATATGRSPVRKFGGLIPRQVLEPAVADSGSITGVIRLLDLNYGGASRSLTMHSIEVHNLDTSHFTGQGHLKNLPSPQRRSAAEILVEYPPGSTRVSNTRLRRALDEIGRSYLCTDCGVGQIWNGKPLVLEIDHIDGNWLDSRAENLRYLCPCCHSQTPTYRGRNRRILVIE